MIELRTLSNIQKVNPDFTFRIFFDVGAHVGKVSQAFRAYSPNAFIHAFEPVEETCKQLRSNLGSDDRVIINRCALSKNPGIAQFTIGRNTGNRFAKGDYSRLRKTEVSVSTGDVYCASKGVTHIDFLKVDAEGHDLDVLLGFKNLLSNCAISFIQVECTPNPLNSYHAQLSDISHFLSLFNYHLHEIGETRHINNEQRMRTSTIWFCNAIFTHHVEKPF